MGAVDGARSGETVILGVDVSLEEEDNFAGMEEKPVCSVDDFGDDSVIVGVDLEICDAGVTLGVLGFSDVGLEGTLEVLTLDFDVESLVKEGVDLGRGFGLPEMEIGEPTVPESSVPGMDLVEGTGGLGGFGVPFFSPRVSCGDGGLPLTSISLI